MDSSVIEKARNRAEAAHRHMPTVIDKIRYRREPIDVHACYSLLSDDHLKLGIYDYLANGDIKSFKQNFYVASKLVMKMIDMEGDSSFDSGRNILFALLSDNDQIINGIACVETPELIRDRNNPLSSTFFAHMLQLAIRNENNALQEKIEKVAKHGKKPNREESASGQDFFSLLLKKDKDGLERLIQKKHAHIKSQNPLYEDFMSYIGTLETKLCWFKGIHVQIDSPLVPMDLMPVQPLEHYDDVYDFLKPGWTPPPQGMLAKLSNWLGGR